MKTVNDVSKNGVFILGSTGKTGELLTTALLPDRDVVVMHRNDKRRDQFETLGARVMLGDAMDRDSMFAVTAEAAADCNVVVSFIGGIPFSDVDAWPDYTGNVNAIDAALAAGIRRFVLVTSIGTGSSVAWVPENSAFLLPLLELKTHAEEYLRSTDLDWTILKPGGLADSADYPDDEPVLLTENPAVRGVITRKSLADAAAQIIADHGGKTFGKELHAVAHKIAVFEGEPVPVITS